jgi:curved DNA-binding protein
MEFIDYYSVLGVVATTDAKTIKTAYRKLGRKYHPDVSKLPNTAEIFKRVAEAYEVLHSTEKRILCSAPPWFYKVSKDKNERALR